MNENKKAGFLQIRLFAKNIVRIFRDVWQDEKGLILITAFVSVGIAITPFLRSGSNALFVDGLIRTAQTHLIDHRFTLVIAFLIFATIIPSFLYLMQGFFQKRLYFHLGKKYELMFVQKRGEIDIAQYEDPEFNNLVNRVNEKGVWVIQNTLNDFFYNIQSIIEIAVASAIIVHAAWWMFLIILTVEIPGLIVNMKYGKDAWFIYGDGVNAETRRKFWSMREYFMSLPKLIELKLFRNLAYFRNALSDLLGDFYLKLQKNERTSMRYKIFASLLSQGAFVFIVLYLVASVVHGSISVGSFLFTIAAVGSFQNSLSGLLGSLGRNYESHLFISDFFTFMDTPPLIDKKGSAIVSVTRAPEITFEDISFHYPGSEKKVYEHFNLVIKPGTKLALIGLNGAGKTTLIKLLCRFYEPTSGRILLDGVDIREISLEKWYEQLGALFQEYGHYQMNVGDLIALGKTEEPKDDGKVKAAAHAADADQFINAWSKAYEQQLGKEFTDGVEPSIGQWQKLALARVFYRDPAVWILDEPTSSIDADAEAKIFERLAQLPEDKTVIMISHRFSTVRNADTICVIDEGKVREIGTHEELMARNDEYARLFNLQAKGYK